MEPGWIQRTLCPWRSVCSYLHMYPWTARATRVPWFPLHWLLSAAGEKPCVCCAEQERAELLYVIILVLRNLQESFGGIRSRFYLSCLYTIFCLPVGQCFVHSSELYCWMSKISYGKQLPGFPSVKTDPFPHVLPNLHLKWGNHL